MEYVLKTFLVIMFFQIYNDRDELLLSEENHVEEKRLDAIFDNIINLLSKFDESRLFLVCEDVISSIKRVYFRKYLFLLKQKVSSCERIAPW
jgi:hypothetical protein